MAYACTESDLRALFEKFGPLAELTIPVDNVTKKSKAFAFVGFVMPEHAVTAFTELDGTIFQGRLLHLIPAKDKGSESGVVDDSTGGVPWKKKKDDQQRTGSSNPFNWNTLFMRADTVADAMASSYGISKSEMLDKVWNGACCIYFAMLAA